MDTGLMCASTPSTYIIEYYGTDEINEIQAFSVKWDRNMVTWTNGIGQSIAMIPAKDLKRTYRKGDVEFQVVPSPSDTKKK